MDGCMVRMDLRMDVTDRRTHLEKQFLNKITDR